MPESLPENTETFSIEKREPFSRIALVAIDIDGTLLNSNESELSSKILKLFKSLKNHRYKVKVTIATGRTYAGSRLLLKAMSLTKDTPIILYNGAIVLDGNYNILRKDDVSIESFRRVIHLSSQYNVQVLAYACNWYSANEPEEYAFGWSSGHRPSTEYNKMPVEWLDWRQRDCPILPSAIVIHTKGQAEAISGICSGLSQISDLSFSLGGTNYIEVKSKNSNKGVALEYVANKLKLDRHQVLAIGDNDNDAEMLLWAGIGVAIDSASELALANSDYKARGVIEGAIQVLSIVQEARHLFPNAKTKFTNTN